MGFIEYAWSISFQKDLQKVKILQDSKLEFPALHADDFGFTIKLPIVHNTNDGQFLFLGYKFPANSQGKVKIGRLFRASVLHLTTHTLLALPKDKAAPSESDPINTGFVKSLIRDVFVNGYLQAWYPDRFTDLAYANAFAYQKIKPSNRIFAPSTRVMTAILTNTSVGCIKGTLSTEEMQVVNAVCQELGAVKDTFMLSLADNSINIAIILEEKTKILKQMLESFGPFLEVPSLRHTEHTGKCSIYTEAEIPTEDLEGLFVQSIQTLGGTIPTVDNIEQCWRPEQEAEAMQAFNSDQHSKERREKILAKISHYMPLTRFKGLSFPEEDYSQYLRTKNLIPGTSRRVLDALRTALDYLDEDPRQEMGQLDLSAVIQAIASSKPATDVFVLDEYLKQSFAWSIVMDVSGSMQVRGENGRAFSIAIAEAAKELMTDASSWTMFAFSDRLYILKDSTESYSQRVRARIGGLRFGGLTYIPDAVRMAGKMLAKRFEEQRILIVISDGWPYGYQNMPIALKEEVDDLLRKGVIVIGVGVETSRMGNFFKLNASIYTPKDLMKKFANVYVEASAKALET